MTGGPSAGEGRFRASTIVADALAMHPKARWVFAAYHVGGCDGCDLAREETLEQLATGYGLPLDRFLADLNGLGDTPR